MPSAMRAGGAQARGLTAWAGVTKLASVGDGDVFLVNAAAGPVGGTAGQIARARGAKTVIGIASALHRYRVGILPREPRG